MEKKTYEAPTLIEDGSFEEITKSVTGGQKTDVPFPQPTPLNEITSS